MLMESALQAIRDHGMIAPGDRVLIAVSGGLDSVVLLDVLHRLAPQLQCESIVGHIDHGLRGADSAGDAAFVETLAASYGLPVYVHRLDPSDLEISKTHGREGAARVARLAALEAMASRADARRIALAHTANDRAETVLYRLARGAGSTGLRGILPVRGMYVRPLLGITRGDIADYAQAHGLDWREDASNADLSFARNRIRHEVLPELRELNPEAVHAVCRAADLLTDLDEALDYFVTDCADRMSGGATFWPRDGFRELPGSAARLLVREAIRRTRGNLDGITLQHVDAVRSLVTGTEAHGELSLPRLRVRVDREFVSFASQGAGGEVPADLALDLGDNPLPDGSTLQFEILPHHDTDPAPTDDDPWTEVADADRVVFPLRLRVRAPGDRFRPLGLAEDVRLKDFLINAKTPYYDRDRIPLVCDGNGIIWVVGLRLSDTVKVSERTRRVLRMKLKGLR